MAEKALPEGVARGLCAENRKGIAKGLPVCEEYFEGVAKGFRAESRPSESYFVPNEYK